VAQNFAPENPAWEARVRASFARQSLMSTLNAELLSLAPGRCTIRSTYGEGLSQQHGLFHAGVASASGDSACGYAAFTLFPEDAKVLTAEVVRKGRRHGED
jgi:acyl-coenzyme A thioesterase PaaI-like protein